jgi:glycosyltransferase 2 family protein
MKRLIKILIAASLIGLLLYQADVRTLAARVADVPLWGLAVALLIMIWELLLSTWRWSRVLTLHGLHFSLSYLFRVLTNGYFFNNFLPSAVGGDAYRVYRTLPPDSYRSRALSAVLVDRISGFGALLVLGALAAIVLHQHEVSRAYLLVFCAAGAAGVAGLIAASRGWLKFVTNRVRHHPAFDAIEHNWRVLRGGGAAWLPIVASAVLFQCTSIGLVYWLFVICGAPQPFTYCALMTAASGVAALLPLSINGIGLMEGSLVGMAVALGIDLESATLVALVRRLLMFTLSLLCGIGYLFDADAAPRRSLNESQS